MDSPMAGQAVLTVDASFPSAAGLLTALTSIRAQKKQQCVVVFASEGLTVKWEHQSKTLQSGVFLGHGLFTTYTVHEETQFSLPLHTLLDTLAVFVSSDMGEITLRYPGPDAELLLESIEDIPGNALDFHGASGAPSDTHTTTTAKPCTYARVSTVEGAPFCDILEYLTDPCSYFICQGALLKEAVDDVEWTKESVTVEMERDPAVARLKSSRDSLALDVDIPVGLLSSFHSATPRLSWSYKSAHLRTAFAHIAPTRGDPGTVTKVTMDANGLMKVTHMLRVPAAPDEPQDVATHPLASAGTQAGVATARRLAVAQFALLPCTEDAEDDEGTQMENVDDSEARTMTF